MSREIEYQVSGQPTSDGEGVKLLRVLTQQWQRRLDPFLMLDEFKSDDAADYIAGFPDHPHRGFETVTYMLAGRMKHRDSAGNKGDLGPGSVQWMTAGRGLVHSETPMQEEGLMHGFQLWVNLPAEHKMTAPRYQDIPAQMIPELSIGDTSLIRVLAGCFNGTPGPVQQPLTDPLYWDIKQSAGETVHLPIPQTHNAFLYVYEGSVIVGGQNTALGTRRMGVLSQSADSVTVSTQSPARYLVIAGKPINEPIVQYGPFVMNSRQEIEQAIDDYRQGLMG